MGATEREALGLDSELPPAPEFTAEDTPASPTTEAAAPLPAAEPPLEPLAAEEPAPAPLAVEPEPRPAPPPAPSLEAAARNLDHRRKDNQRNKWSAGVVVTPRTFRNADWKARPNVNAGNLKSPHMLGIFLQGERILTDRVGLIGIGPEVGLIGSPVRRDGFENLTPAILSVGALASYRARFVPRQWVVPFGRGGVEFLRYAYHYNNARITGTRFMPRLEAGLDIYLNAFDPSSAGNMYAEYSVLRSFLSVAYSVTHDSSKKDFDLSDRALRAGVRFEF